MAGGERPPRWRGYRTYARPASDLLPGYEVVVVGAGIGGLVCGALLATLGRRVAVIDAHAVPGGLCSYFKRKGFHFDAGAHYFAAIGDARSFAGLVLKPLALDLTFLPQDPVEVLHFPDRVVPLPANYFDYVATLQRQHPDEAGAIAAFFDDALRVYRHQNRGHDSPLLRAWRDETFTAVLSERFHSPELRGCIGASVGFIGVRPSEVSAAAMAVLIMSYHYDGGYLLEGGSQSLPDSLMRRLVERGGHLTLGTRVRRIRVEQGHASAVELESGQFVAADVVVSNADAHQTMMNMVGTEHLGQAYADALEAMRASNSMLVTYLGLACDAERLRGLRGWYWESYDLDAAGNRWRYVATPTLEDPSLAPPGHHILTVSSVCEERVASDEALYDETWTRRRTDYFADTIAWLDSRTPGLSSHVVASETATRRTVHNYTGNSRGAVYGWSSEPGQFGSDRLAMRTPVPNLFLCGHWTEPGAGVAAAVVSGALASRCAASVLARA